MTSQKTRLIIPPARTLLTVLLSLFVLWAPFPYGGVTPTALLAVRVVAASAILLTAAANGIAEGVRSLRLALLGLLGLAGLAWLQSLRWPTWVVRRVSPEHLQLLVDHGGVETTEQGSVPLSLAPLATQSAALTTLAIAGFLLAGFCAGRHLRQRRWLAGAFLAAALLQVIFGLRPWLAGRVPRVAGTFVNPDHFSVYLEIALSVGLAVIWGVSRRLKFGPSPEVRLLAVGGAMFLWLFLFCGLLFTGSRAGLLAVFVGMAVESVLVAVAWRRARIAGVALAGSLGLGLVVIALSGVRGVRRLIGSSWYDSLFQGRPRIWAESWSLVTDFPLLGTGLGSFEEAFPLAQSEISARILWARAHNDYLELLVTAGAVGLILGITAVVGVIRPLVTVVRTGARTEDRLAAVAALSALAAVGMHEAFDFGLSLPANSSTLAILIGAASASRVGQEARGAAPRPAAVDPRERRLKAS